MSCMQEFKYDDSCVCVAFSPFSGNIDEQQSVIMAMGLADNIALCDPVSGSILHTLRGHEQLVSSVAFSPCGRFLASGSWDHTVRLWEMLSKECVAVLEGYTSWVRSVAFSPNGSLLASGSDDKTVRLWDVETRLAGPVLRGHTNDVYCVAFSPSNRLLASASFDRTLRLWNMPEGTPGPVISHSGIVYCVAFSCNNLIASGSANGSVRLWDVSEALNGEEAKLVRELKDFSGVSSVAFSPDGKQLASGLRDSTNNTVKLWSVLTGDLLKTLDGLKDWNRNFVVFHPSGHQLASASYDKTVRIWTVCEWSDRLHHLFGAELKRLVFVLMCIKNRQEEDNNNKLCLPMQLWLSVFQMLATVAQC